MAAPQAGSGQRAAGRTAPGTAGRTGSTSTPSIAQQAFAERARGATAGVTSQGRQQVFASPATAAARKAARSAATGAGAAPSDRSAAGDLWSGFSPSKRPSVLGAPAVAATQGNGVGSSFALGLAIAALGVAGLSGALLVGGLRRRRARAGSGAGTG